MKFEEAAALKILFGREDVQVITKDRPCEGEGPIDGPDGRGVIVEDHGIIDVDVVIWDRDAAILRLAEELE